MSRRFGSRRLSGSSASKRISTPRTTPHCLPGTADKAVAAVKQVEQPQQWLNLRAMRLTQCHILRSRSSLHAHTPRSPAAGCHTHQFALVLLSHYAAGCHTPREPPPAKWFVRGAQQVVVLSLTVNDPCLHWTRWSLFRWNSVLSPAGPTCGMARRTNTAALTHRHWRPAASNKRWRLAQQTVRSIIEDPHPEIIQRRRAADCGHVLRPAAVDGQADAPVCRCDRSASIPYFLSCHRASVPAVTPPINMTLDRPRPSAIYWPVCRRLLPTRRADCVVRRRCRCRDSVVAVVGCRSTACSHLSAPVRQRSLPSRPRGSSSAWSPPGQRSVWWGWQRQVRARLPAKYGARTAGCVAVWHNETVRIRVTY